MKRVFTVIAVILFSTSCADDNFEVCGKISEDGHGYVYMAACDGKTILDSAEVSEGAFSFSGYADPTEIYIVSAQRDDFSRGVCFVPEKGTIRIDLSSREPASGTVLNDSFAAFAKERKNIIDASNDEFGKLRTRFVNKEISDEEFQKARTEHSKKYDPLLEELHQKCFNENIDNPLSALVLSNWMTFFDYAKMDSLLKLMPAQSADYYPIRKKMDFERNVLETRPGNPFRNFTGYDLDGNTSELADFVGQGKYVLVDFWATWCVPCMGEVPYLRYIYDEYSAKGLVMVGVSVMDQVDRVKNTVAKEKMVWNHIYDRDNVATQTYGINGIPQIILFSPDGTILARDLRGDEMKAKIKEIFSSEK